MPCDSKNFRYIEKILRNSVDNSVLQILLKFQVDRMKIVRIILLAVLKNKICEKRV